jgi:hypothetical protein
MNEFDFNAWMNRPINANFDWSVEAQVRARSQNNKKSAPALINLPEQQAPAPIGAVGRLTPTPHETAILRRVARGLIIVTMRDGKPLHTFEDGTLIRNGSGNPLTKKEFARLSQFLVPREGDCLFDTGVAQRWDARQPK